MNSASASTSTSSSAADAADARDAALKRVQQAMQQGDFAAGRAGAEALLGDDADDSEALYMAAVAARYLKDYAAAAGYLERLHLAAPEYGRAWQENGHLARDKGRDQAAIAAYQRAAQYNPALTASWQALAALHSKAGASAQAAQCRAQAERLAAMPRELLAVTNHLHEGRVLRAEEICRHYLRAHPRDIEAMRLLAQIGIRLGVLDDAEFLLESAIEFAGDQADADTIQLRLDYLDVLHRRQKYDAAREVAEALHQGEPANPLFQSQLAINHMQTGDYERAFALFDRVLETLPGDPATLTSRGHALKTTGQQDEAVASYRAAIAARPELGDAWYALANLKTWRFDDSDVAAMRALSERADLAYGDRVHIAFALAKALEDRGEYEESFAHYEAGNTLKRVQTRYSAGQMSAELARQAELVTPELIARHQGAGHGAPDPIFILGLPRAGSTLLEQILASHSQIDGTLELPNILALAHRLRGRKAGESLYPAVLHELSAEQLADFGADYIEKTRIHRQGATYFIDKMPNNFRHIGLIQLILPNAKIIDARRDPMDCCFSGYKQLFAEGQEFTYGLNEIGRYYADYVKLMTHWDTVLPGKVLRVQHEDVLDDLEGQTRRMLDYLGLPFEEACLDFHKTKRAVRTASSEQVRRPINRAGQGAWKPYEPWLGPLKEGLGGLV